jgi:hypothetical protein
MVEAVEYNQLWQRLLKIIYWVLFGNETGGCVQRLELAAVSSGFARRILLKISGMENFF